MLGPANGTNVTNRMLTLSWQAVTGATAYELRLDTSTSFTQPIIPVAAALSYRTVTPLNRGTYYWQVRALDAAGNASAWSTSGRLTSSLVSLCKARKQHLFRPHRCHRQRCLQVVEAETVTTSGIWTSIRQQRRQRWTLCLQQRQSRAIF